MTQPVYEKVIASLPPDRIEEFPPAAFSHVESTGSTNDDLLTVVRKGNALPFQTLVADYQTSGRGRRGDKWESSPGSNLLFSIALPLGIPPAIWARLPHLVGYVAGSAVESIVGSIEVQSKWPNDLLFEDQKFCGVLVETTTTPTPWAVAGIGLNLNMRRAAFPGELRDVVTSLYEMMGCESNRWFVLGEIISGFLESYPQRIHDFDSVLAWARHRDFLHGKPVRLKTETGEIEGTATGLGPEGELLVSGPGNREIPVFSADQLCVG